MTSFLEVVADKSPHIEPSSLEIILEEKKQCNAHLRVVRERQNNSIGPF